MCSRKKIGARMEPWRSAPLMEYSCENFLSRTTCNHLLLKNEKIRLTWNSRRFRFIQKTAWLYQKPCIYHVLQLKQPQICWKHRQFCQTLVRRAVEEEDLKFYWWSENRPHIWMWSRSLSCTSLSKIFQTMKWQQRLG